MAKNTYGNITLSQITHFIVGICGKDALIKTNTLSESELNDAYKERGSFYKFRYTHENSIFGRVRRFFAALEEEFNLTLIEFTQKKSLDGRQWETKKMSYCQIFYNHLIWHYIISIAGIRPFENTQNNLSKKTIYDCILRQQPESPIYEYIQMTSRIKFETLFNEAVRSADLTYEEFYNKVSEYMTDKNTDNFSRTKRSLEKCRKENKLPTWDIFYPLLKTVFNIDKEYAEIFINFYFYHNLRENLEFISLKKNDWYKLEQLIINDYTKNIYQWNLKVCNFIDQNTNMQMLKSINHYAEYFDKLKLKNTRSSIQKFYEDSHHIRTKLPHSKDFWEIWFCAKDYVIKYTESDNLNNLEEAINQYLKAFQKYKYFAGKSLEDFIHEAISVSAYYDFKKNPKQSRSRIQKSSTPTETKTPLDKTTKEFYDFGLAFDLLLNDISDSYNVFYNCPQNFWNRFPAQTEIASSDMLSSCGIKIYDTNFEDQKKELRKQLLDISDKKINQILPSDHNVAYTPISKAITFNMYDIAERYLNKGLYPSLDLNIPNTNNCYPVHEILTCYKKRQNTQIQQLFFEILKRTDKKHLFTETNRRKIAPLQTAIETLDPEILAAVLEKMLDSSKYFKEDFYISADELSPLYYALNYKYSGLNPALMAKACMETPNINYKNLSVPGLSADEKNDYFFSNPNYVKFLESIIQNFKEDSETMTKKEEKVNSIIDMLIERTKNIDDFVMTNRIGVKSNVLLLACEKNDVLVCKKLINAGADLNVSIGIIPEAVNFVIKNNFINRAIHFGSWDCLEMFLVDHKNIAAQYMHRKDENITPFVYFLISIMNESNRPEPELIKKFQPLFLAAGTSMNEPTAIGSAKDILQNCGVLL
ncbi:hypothetical protein E4O05_02830 [Treponema sp. OMZ 787]|uniref:hypothetical protein n=1 Tax=Treponema sp. OMZ 787 TaxID=2563669 RepID=UPI0020A429BA|nr:hypothetical protein [Treponema sp. OMZ 787]UTC62848.1 hypothetical protein E4O05_02830 [Treponema sp. OMZ 787]